MKDEPGNRDEPLVRWALVWLLVVVPVLLWLASCTSVHYKHPDGHSLRVVDFHPVGGAVDLEAILDGTGSVRATREQGSTVSDAAGLVPVLTAP